MKKRISHEDQITFNNAPSLVCVSQPKLSKIPIMNTTTNLASNSIDVEDDEKENLVKIRISNIDHHYRAFLLKVFKLMEQFLSLSHLNS